MRITTVSDIITKKVLNENTGELENQDYKQLRKSKHIKGGFTMVYKSYDEALLDVVKSKKDLELVLYVRDLFTYRQVEHNLSAAEIASVLSVSRQKVTTLLKLLVTAKLLKKVSKTMYRLNPYMYLPYRADGEALQREWNELD